MFGSGPRIGTSNTATFHRVVVALSTLAVEKEIKALILVRPE